MPDSFHIQLRRIGEKAEADYYIIRDKLLQAITNTCYQNGDIKAVKENQDLCWKTSSYMTNLFKEITRVLLYSKNKRDPPVVNPQLLADLNMVLDTAGEKTRVWLKCKKKAMINNKIVDEETIINVSIEEAIPMILLNIAEPLRISMFLNQKKEKHL